MAIFLTGKEMKTHDDRKKVHFVSGSMQQTSLVSFGSSNSCLSQIVQESKYIFDNP